jgi:hypothetical protein
MGLFSDIAHLFGFHDGDNRPSQEDLEEAAIIDEFIREGGEGEEYYEEGVHLGTAPSTNPGYEGEDTDKHDTSLIRRILGF